MNIVLALSLFLLEASVLGSPLKHVTKRKVPFKRLEHKIRIVGGVEVTPHSIPYQVGLVLDSSLICGGVLISTKYVLTVAHCTYHKSSITVILGAHNIRCDEDTQVMIYGSTIINHANYTGDDLENDISLIKLNQNIQPTFAIKAVDSLAPKNSMSYAGDTGQISGWGLIHTSGRTQSKLRKTYVEIISNDRCQMFLKGRNSLPNSHICTLGVDELIGPVGACNGDSGGPLVVGDVLVGLVAFGSVICEGGYPTGYTRISYYREWITRHSGV